MKLVELNIESKIYFISIYGLFIFTGNKIPQIVCFKIRIGFLFLQVMELTDNIQLILNVVRSSTVVEVQVSVLFLYIVCGLFRLLVSTFSV